MGEKQKAITADFKKMISALAPASTGKFNYSNYIYFNGEDAIVFNGNVCVFYPFQFPEMLVRFSDLQNIVQNITGKEFDVICGAKSIAIKDEKTKAELGHIIESTAPYNELTQRVMRVKKWHILPDNFWECVKRTSLSASRNERLSILTGIYIHGNTIESSDNQRYTQAILNSQTRINAILLTKHINIFKNMGLNEYAIADGALLFQNKNICAMVTVTPGDYPDYSEVIEEKSYAVFSTEFKGKIRDEFSLLADFAENMEPVNIELSKNGFSCEYSNNYSSLLRDIKVDIELKKVFRFEINPVYFLQAMDTYPKAEVHIKQNCLLIKTDDAIHIIGITLEGDDKK